MVAWRRHPHKTSRLRKPQLHARGAAFPADIIKQRDTCSCILNLTINCSIVINSFHIFVSCDASGSQAFQEPVFYAQALYAILATISVFI